MRGLTLLLAALLTSSMFAATAAGNSDRSPGVCRFLEQRVDQCDSGKRLSLETRASCDRFEQGFRDLCGALGTIVATESADSAALDLLRQDYEIVPIEDAVFPYDHVVIGPADLGDPDVADLLRKAYRAGKTVAITDATEDQVRSFHRLIFAGQAADCMSPDHTSWTIELYGLQQSANPPRTGSYCLRNLEDRDPPADRRWLRERFAAKVPAQLTPQPLTDDSNAQLTSIATGKSCWYKETGNVGNVSWQVQVWSMRNFATAQDYYLVNFNPTLTPVASNITEYVVNTLRPKEVKSSTSEDIVTTNAFIIDDDPAQTTSHVSSYDNSSSTTVGGSAGIDGTNVQVSANASVTIGNSTTTTIPPVTILNQTNTLIIAPSWTFIPQGTIPDTDYEPKTAWVWQIPQSAYPFGGTSSNQLAFLAQANIFVASSAGTNFSSLCNVTVPFQAWSVDAPVLTKLVNSSAAPGDNVTVEGQYMYPDVVTNVFLGGAPVAPSNLIFGTSSTSFTLIVPNVGTGSKNVQVETDVIQTQLSNTLPLDITD